MIITKSKLLQFKKCPLSFKFQYLDKRERDTIPAKVTTIGLDIHKIFNDFFDVIDINCIPKNPYNYFCNCLDVKEEYKQMFYKFCEWESTYFNSNQNFMPIMREQTVKALDLYGIIDRINFDGYNYSIIDYKSGIYNLSELRFELCFYKYLVDSAKILDKPIMFIGSYGYNKGDIFFEPIKERSYNLMLEKVEKFRNLKFKEILYPKKTGYHCQWCEYQIACSNTDIQLNFGDFLNDNR